MEVWERSRSIFWNEWFWLPRNVSWNDLVNKPGSGTYYPQLTDLLVALAAGISLFCIRKVYEKFIVEPFGVSCGLKEERSRRAPPNEFLEREYKKHKKPADKNIESSKLRASVEENDMVGANISLNCGKAMAKQTDMEVRQIERWFRLRRNQDRASLMKKFTETGWRFTYYLGIFIYGLSILWTKPWLWNSRYCWIGFPKHHLEDKIYWYYMIELGFYLSLMFSQFLDVKRKDFIEMFVHHIATISLLSFSYIANFTRVGTLVLCIHDCADIWVEGAKLAKYLKWDRLCDFLFAIFGMVWLVTRLMCYPVKILYTTWYESREIVGYFPSLYFFNGWLCLLLVLHVYWFSLIVRVAYAALTKSSEVDDVRSSTEEPVTDEPEVNNHVGNSVQNHNHIKSG